MKHRNFIISIGVAVVLLLGATLALATNPDFFLRRVLDEETVKEVQEILDEQSSNTPPVYDGLTPPLSADVSVEAVYSFDTDIKAAFSDADSDPLSPVSVVCGTNCTSVSLNGDAISFTGPAKGSADFTLTVTDGTDNVNGVIPVDIANQPPVYDGLTPPLEAVANVEAVYSFDTDIKAAFSDADSDPISPESVVCGTNCTSVSLNGDAISFTGPAKGSADFTLTVTDGTDNVNGVIPVDVILTGQEMGNLFRAG
ncbi:MAG: hypothetical protein U9N14_00890, partial [Pseudomonadota bacterium]|nr:hypothetical protein [Pseudomonadota bacterium]